MTFFKSKIVTWVKLRAGNQENKPTGNLNKAVSECGQLFLHLRYPTPLKIRRVWGLLHIESYVVAKSFLANLKVEATLLATEEVGKRSTSSVVWNIGEGCARYGFVLVI
ncbi:hypothetical protein AVEN_8356-1 [Araneus ventricosus]|uniref:Uncharacterized protein n=1 Tax=Araneus ventricosus TaxID=182803 RepID=A0A4Y2WCE9_ARAVE|nr:hypothetical protein AVEN_8356-1 [Araneus ventricosus]